MASSNDYIFPSSSSSSSSLSLNSDAYIFPLFPNNFTLVSQNIPSIAIEARNLKIMKRVSHGNFGKVYRGTYTYESSGKTIDVAVKELIVETNDSREKIQAEANLIHTFDHPHVIKLIGICVDELKSLKIVLEYANLGDLETYLREHPFEMEMSRIVNICYQTAMAMEYLTSKSIVHRDLAARNVLLMNRDTCKVTDFGLSRPTNNYNYYTHQVTNDTRLPFKWYPPELIGRSELKFNEKTDVWSFGVTCWEATSYGQAPYKEWTTKYIKDYLENGYRLGLFSF